MPNDDALAAQVSDLASKVESMQPMSIDLTPPQGPGVDPYWDCTLLPDAHAMSGDWETANFDDASLARVLYRVPFSDGYASMNAITTVERPLRYKASFDADAAFSVDGFMCGIGWGNVRIKVNGAETNYVANAVVTFSFRAGRNEIVLMADGPMDGVDLRLRCTDGVHSRWVAP